ncbi:hypothetical protein ANANG_G00079890 [Anguilla anguilla]|uniref:Uncharacterized protein n=1 Tax=Anguilla anguilla TaxID=7936 RepID=A0A9D3MJT3_ANGAN|nr:hypothetical protein ANANG_G00079890 [Anguilla anguilla]
MEEAMIHTAHSQHGTHGKAKLPNFTEDVNWQGLEDLYSVNDSLYDNRPDYSPSLDDWTNFQKDGSPRDSWAQQLEEGLDGDGLIFSGNGFTELETRHDFLLRSSSTLQADLPPPAAGPTTRTKRTFSRPRATSPSPHRL